MTDTKQIFDSRASDQEFDALVLTEFPYPIAVNYQRLLKATTPLAKIDDGLQIYEFGLRTVTLVIINQYLNQDINKVNDEGFNQLLANKLPENSLGDWVNLFFRSLQAYEGKQDLFFTPELYEILWDITNKPHKRHKGVRKPFQRLVELRNNKAHLRLADSEENAQEVLQNLRTVLLHFHFICQYDLIRITGALC